MALQGAWCATILPQLSPMVNSAPAPLMAVVISSAAAFEHTAGWPPKEPATETVRRVFRTSVPRSRLGSVVHRYGRGLAIVNGGMESGVAPWYAYYGAQASISTVARTGALSLRVTTPIVDRGVYQEVKDLVPGRTYEFRAWVRAESGTTLAALAVCDPNYSAFVWTGVYTVGTTWQMLSVTFTANSMGVARVHLAKHDITGAQLWDDVELVNGATAVKFVRPAYPVGAEDLGESAAEKLGIYDNCIK